MQGAEDLRLLVGADAIAERGQAVMQLGPEGHTPANRHGGVDRTQRADMLRVHLPARPSALDEAGLKAVP